MKCPQAFFKMSRSHANFQYIMIRHGHSDSPPNRCLRRCRQFWLTRSRSPSNVTIS